MRCLGCRRCPALGPLLPFGPAVRAGVVAGPGRWGALLRSCPPEPACGRLLLLYFAPQSTPPSWSASAAELLRTSPLVAAKDGGWPAERSEGGEARAARLGGHERSRPPGGLGLRNSRARTAATGRQPPFSPHCPCAARCTCSRMRAASEPCTLAMSSWYFSSTPSVSLMVCGSSTKASSSISARVHSIVSAMPGSL